MPSWCSLVVASSTVIFAQPTEAVQLGRINVFGRLFPDEIPDDVDTIAIRFADHEAVGDYLHLLKMPQIRCFVLEGSADQLAEFVERAPERSAVLILGVVRVPPVRAERLATALRTTKIRAPVLYIDFKRQTGFSPGLAAWRNLGTSDLRLWGVKLGVKEWGDIAASDISSLTLAAGTRLDLRQGIAAESKLRALTVCSNVLAPEQFTSLLNRKSLPRLMRLSVADGLNQGNVSHIVRGFPKLSLLELSAKDVAPEMMRPLRRLDALELLVLSDVEAPKDFARVFAGAPFAVKVTEAPGKSLARWVERDYGDLKTIWEPEY